MTRKYTPKVTILFSLSIIYEEKRNL